MHLTNARTIIISNKIREIRWKIDNTEKSESSINRGGEETNRKGRESSETSCSKVITSTQRVHQGTRPRSHPECFRVRSSRIKETIGNALVAKMTGEEGGGGEGDRHEIRWGERSKP